MNQQLLESEIRLYDEKYRQGDPIISDKEYDALIEVLKENFPDSELLKKGVIDQKISRKQKLPFQMASLNKVKSIEEFKKWYKLFPSYTTFIITPKYDGISLVVNEVNDRCWTRGDGEFGQYSSTHFEKVNKGSATVVPVGLYSYGEAIMSKVKFEQYSSEFANPRNLVAGLFNRDVAKDELKDVDYVRYGSNLNIDKIEQLKELNSLNAVKVPYWMVEGREITEKLLDALYERWSTDYQIDGLVIEFNDHEKRVSLGREENGNPAYVRAFKNPKWSSGAEVRVTGVTWQVSKQGKLKPVIQIDPTQIAGVTVTNVTGYNAKYVFDNNICEGSTIEVIRSGDVIPKHINTLNYDIDSIRNLADDVAVCPSCGEPTVWDNSMTEILCVNNHCKEKNVMKIVHFFNTMDVEDFGEPSIRVFFEAGFNTIELILNMHQIDIISIEGFGSKSSAKLLSQFGKIKQGVPFAKLLHALDLFEGVIGEKVAQKIFDEAEDFNDFTSILKVEGVADKVAKSFLNGLIHYNNMKHLSSIKVKYIETPKVQVTNDTYKGIKVCFTGCRPNKEQLEELNYGGGEMVSGVSKNTTHLVVKDLSEKVLSSNKSQKAKSFGIKIIPIKEFFV